MKMYKVIATIEVNIEADSYEEAEMNGVDCLDWSNADIEVLEIEDEEHNG